MPLDLEKLSPLHPLGWRCDRCPCWLASQKREFVHFVRPGPGGGHLEMAPAEDFKKAGLVKPRDSVSLMTAPCTRFPAWTLKGERDYCYEYPRMVSLYGTEELKCPSGRVCPSTCQDGVCPETGLARRPDGAWRGVPLPEGPLNKIPKRST
jgi:hypothetical protein